MFRVLQFNMQFGQGWEPNDPDKAPVDLDATIAEIRRHDADIILLQEVERVQADGMQADPPPHYTRLSEGLAGYHGCLVYPNPDARELPFGFGLAIFSRTPLRTITRIDLPSPPIEFEFGGKKLTPTDRLLIGAKTTVHGRDVQLFNTHLLAFFMLGTSSTAHPLQRAMIAREIAASSGPTVLAGDFNVRNHAELSAQYSAVGFRTVQDKMVTWRRQPYVLDHIFHNESLRLMSQKVVPTLTSDHHVLVADFEFV
jgi:endonuclease/exonuclease/phosphatase family metal-dependent hydrolase